MILVVDVQYFNDKAIVAGILFENWKTDEIKKEYTKPIDNIAPYEAGAFYKRELPCIVSLLEDIKEKIDIIVIDGFVSLGKDEKDGLGMYLHKKLNKKILVIGVAKRAFAKTPKKCEIVRISSIKPLYITSVGIPLEEAKELILNMHGENRIPTLLKRVDQLCRGIIWQSK